MKSLAPITRVTELVPRPKTPPLITPRQLDFVLDDVVLQGLTAAQRHAALKALAQLLLKASGAATTEIGDDHE
jgi:hypothetical protein